MFKKKLILGLSKAKDLKDSLENIIESINKKIEVGNLDTKLNIRELENIKQIASNLLVTVHSKLQKANTKRISIFKFLSNNNTIKKLSELNRDLKHYNLIQLPTEEISKKNKKTNTSDFKSHISKEEIDTKIRILQSQINILQNQLSKFNSKRRIKVKLNKDIQKVLDYINANLYN